MTVATLERTGLPYWSLPVGAGLLALLTIGAVIASDGSVAAAVAPAVVAAVVAWMWKAPLRASVLLLMFTGLVLEDPAQLPAGGAWRSPLYTLGALMLAHLNVTTGIGALFFSGIDVLIGFLFVVIVHRRLAQRRAARVDSGGVNPIRPFAWLSLLGTFAWWGYGVLHGGNVSASLWQINKLYYLPLLAILFDTAFGESRSYAPLGRVLVLAACVKAAFAVWVGWVAAPSGTPYATTHADSLLFASAISLIIALAMDRDAPGRRMALLGALPLIVAGTIANNRRVAWVAVAWAAASYYLVTPSSPRKRALTRAGLLSLPFLVAYVAVGSGSDSKVFAPARLVVSVLDSDADSSTRWRDMENFNLVHNIGANPLFGTGFGHEYVERWPLPDVSKGFAMYRYLPHNGVLALIAFCGYFGFLAQWLLLVSGLFFAALAYRHAGRPVERVATLCSVAAIVIYMIGGYGDTVLGSWSGVFIVAPALALSGRLAAATGAWRRPQAGAIAIAATRFGAGGPGPIAPSRGQA